MRINHNTPPLKSYEQSGSKATGAGTAEAKQNQADAPAGQKVNSQSEILERAAHKVELAATNASAAESAVTDVELAEEMVELTKNNIISNASQAMEAQTNRLPESARQLLQS